MFSRSSGQPLADIVSVRNMITYDLNNTEPLNLEILDCTAPLKNDHDDQSSHAPMQTVMH